VNKVTEDKIKRLIKSDNLIIVTPSESLFLFNDKGPDWFYNLFTKMREIFLAQGFTEPGDERVKE